MKFKKIFLILTLFYSLSSYCPSKFDVHSGAPDHIRRLNNVIFHIFFRPCIVGFFHVLIKKSIEKQTKIVNPGVNNLGLILLLVPSAIFYLREFSEFNHDMQPIIPPVAHRKDSIAINLANFLARDTTLEFLAGVGAGILYTNKS